MRPNSALSGPKGSANFLPESVISAFPSRSGSLRSSGLKLQGTAQPFVGIQGSSAISKQTRSKSERGASPLRHQPSPIGGANGANAGEEKERVVFVESAKHPGVPVLYRNKSEKSASLERLNLDRRKLTVCPILCGEEQLRLLNYQNNFITKIENLENLPNLIFLDLYSNQIKAIECLECVPSLRVLMLGKNEIRKIENLTPLRRLDVLDLHSNQVSKIENLDHLTELRVLNMAGNLIKSVNNLKSLQSLTEINLRRNKIEIVFDLDQLPYLQRVFLSNNCIENFENVNCIFGVKYLAELSLDGNPVASQDQYRRVCIENCKALRHLDLRRISDEERKAVALAAKKEEERLAEELKQKQKSPKSGYGDNIVQNETAVRSEAVDREDGTLVFMQGRLDISGKAIASLANALAEAEGADLTAVSIRSCSIQAITDAFMKASRDLVADAGSLTATAQLSNLHIEGASVHQLHELQSLAQLLHEASARNGVFRNITHLEIVKNPIQEKYEKHVRQFLIASVPHLVSVNGTTVSIAEKQKSLDVFGGHAKAFSLKSKLLSASGDLSPSPLTEASELDLFSQAYINDVVQSSTSINHKLRSLSKLWPELIRKEIEAVASEMVKDYHLLEHLFSNGVKILH